MTEVSDFRSLPPEVQAVLRKYRIIAPVKSADGTTAEGWAQARIDSTEGSGDGHTPLGPGPLLDPNVIARFLAADKTPNKLWLDWMLFHSGGGKEGQKRAEHLLQKSHALFIEERVKGYTENVDGRNVVYPPRPRPKSNSFGRNSNQNSALTWPWAIKTLRRRRARSSAIIGTGLARAASTSALPPP
jgi:hypothetical protein